jgi:hypothetical protein
MTIKQIAEIAGCKEITVREWIRKLYPDLIKRGKKTVLSDQQSIQVMEKLPKRNMVGNEPVRNVTSDLSQNTQVDLLPLIAGMQKQQMEMQKQNQEFMLLMMKELKDMKNNNEIGWTIDAPPLEIEAPKLEPRPLLRKMVSDYAGEQGVEYRAVWMELYSQILYRTGVNVNVRARNIGIKPIQYLEENDMLLDAIAIFKEVFSMEGE